MYTFSNRQPPSKYVFSSVILLFFFFFSFKIFRTKLSQSIIIVSFPSDSKSKFAGITYIYNNATPVSQSSAYEKKKHWLLQITCYIDTHIQVHSDGTCQDFRFSLAKSGKNMQSRNDGDMFGNVKTTLKCSAKGEIGCYVVNGLSLLQDNTVPH